MAARAGATGYRGCKCLPACAPSEVFFLRHFGTGFVSGFVPLWPSAWSSSWPGPSPSSSPSSSAYHQPCYEPSHGQTWHGPAQGTPFAAAAITISRLHLPSISVLIDLYVLLPTQSSGFAPMPRMERRCNAASEDAHVRRDPQADPRRIEACKRTAMAAQATIIRSDPRRGATMFAAAKVGACIRRRTRRAGGAALVPSFIPAEGDVAAACARNKVF
jgi:hypothetical protein